MKIIAADIASVSDYTAAAVLAVSDDAPRRYYLSALDRWREKYTVTGERLAGLAHRHPDAVLVIDATGVGRPVLDALRDALPSRAVYGITITGGRSVNRGRVAGDVTVPKADLVGALQVLLQTRRLSWPRELALWEAPDPGGGREADQGTGYGVTAAPASPTSAGTGFALYGCGYALLPSAVQLEGWEVIVYTGDGPLVFAPLLVVFGGPVMVQVLGEPLIGPGLVIRSLIGVLLLGGLALSGSWCWRRGRRLNAHGTLHTVYFIPFQYFAFVYWGALLVRVGASVPMLLGR